MTTTNEITQEPPAEADKTKSDTPAAKSPGAVSRKKSTASPKKASGATNDGEPVGLGLSAAIEPVAVDHPGKDRDTGKKGGKKRLGEKKGKKVKEKKKKKNKSAVIIRFDDEHIPLVDARAEALGLSRAAWVRMVVAQALTKA